MKYDISAIINELHSVYTYCELDTKLQIELCEIIYQVAAGLFETVYISLVGIELEIEKNLRNTSGVSVHIVYSFYRSFNSIETIVND